MRAAAINDTGGMQSAYAQLGMPDLPLKSVCLCQRILLRQQIFLERILHLDLVGP